MAKKKVARKKKPATKKCTGKCKRTKECLCDMSFSDLFALYQFVLSDADRSFNQQPHAKKVIGERLKEIEEAMQMRAYGENPFKPVTIEGEEPEKVDLTQFDGKNKNFVVAREEDKELADDPAKTFAVFTNDGKTYTNEDAEKKSKE